MSDGRSFTCKNGTMTGTYEETDPSTGKLRTELRFNDGLLSGPAVIYNSDSGEIEAYAEYQKWIITWKDL